VVRIGDGGSEEGIDPSALQSMIGAMKTSTGSALSLVNGYIGQFSRLGLDTSGLTKAAQDLTWAQGQLPMLSRRQSMAQAAANQIPGLTVTDVGAGPLDFPTDAAAQAAGKADGASALDALTNHSGDQFILTDLQTHQDDPAYMAAFFQALGPQGLTTLGMQVNGYQSNTSEYQNWASTVGDAFAVASYRMPYPSDWINKLQPANDPLADPAMPMLDAITPFLEHGVYSGTWLNPLGQYAIQRTFEEQQPGIAVPPVNLDGIWTALANNQAFDAQFYSDHFTNQNGPPGDSISGIMSSPYMTSLADPAFASMVRSAAIAPTGTDIKPFAANAQLTVRYFGDNPDVHTSGAVRQALGDVAMAYFNDMYGTVGAAAPGIGIPPSGSKQPAPNVPGFAVTASTTEWANFLDEVMRDRTASAQFLTYFSAWRNDPMQVPDNMSPWGNEQVKLMDDFVVHQYQATGQQAGSDPSQIADIVAAGGAAAITSLLFGPEAGVLAALAEGGKDAFQTGVESAISDTFGSNGDQLTNPVPPEAIQQITQADSNWERIVRNWYNEGGKPAQGVSYDGQPAIGDPNYYINEYGGASANFLGGGQPPKLLPLSEIQTHPAQLAAYNAWLQSGAIADAPIPGETPANQLISDFYGQASNSGP
jgi:hypothetical protein